MYTRQNLVPLALVALAFTVSACSDRTDAASGHQSPVVLSEIEGTELMQVTLTEQAVERIGLETGAVAEDSGTKTVPYAAVVYDQDGATWVYTSPEPLTFVRTAITVSEIAGDTAFLTDGPASGTEVVTVGAAELFGAELGLGY